MFAMEGGNLDCAKHALSLGAEPSDKDNKVVVWWPEAHDLSVAQGQTLLMFAIVGGNLDCVKLALSLGGNANDKDNVVRIVCHKLNLITVCCRGTLL